jgi:hypothetical protein
MVLRAYFDVSKTDPIGVTVVAGHVGNEAQWVAVETEWQKALDYWELEHFHLTDLPKIMGHERATLCVRNFAQIITRSDLRGFSAGIRDADWDAMIAESSTDTAAYRAEFPDRYHVVLDMVLGRLSMEINLNLPDEDTMIVLDADYAPVEAAQAIYDRYASKNPRLVGMAILRAPKSKPLQAADLHAGLQRREWARKGFPSERGADYFKDFEIDDRVRMWASGKGSYGSMWSAQIARQIEDAKKRVEADRAKSLKASEGE